MTDKYETVGNIFDIALDNKLRFEYNGLISLEDLYDLDMEELDELYRKYTLKTKEEKIQSLLNNEHKSDNEIKLELIKHAFQVKQNTLKEHHRNIEKQQTKSRILEIIKQKQDTELKNKSIDELIEMINEL